MPTINQLPVVSQLSTGDQIPVYNTVNGDARRASLATVLDFFEQTFAAPTVAVNLYTPATGFSISAPTPISEQQWMILQPAGTLATGTITLPLNTGVPDGTEILITTTQQITALTIGLNGATTVHGLPTMLQAGAGVRLRWYQATNSWYSITADSAPYGAAIRTFLSTPSSANLAAAVTDETGTGALVFQSAPALINPDIGNAVGASVTTAFNQYINNLGKHGYTTGAGGTVTQGAGSGKATSVTLDKPTGTITMNNAALAANTTVTFTLNSLIIEANDLVVLSHISGGTAGAYTLNAQCLAGQANINVRNITAGSLSEAIVLRYAVIKSSNA
ncbi:MAG: hypothetical protein ACK4Y5_06615 [Acetobacteraceae bacterium]|jgi:hypothetical protein